jgi:hypothetical protein
MTSGKDARVRGRLIAGVAGFLLVFCGASCVIATESPPLPSVPAIRPVIVRTLTVPRSDEVMVRLPDEFLVNVEMLAVDEPFEWKLFLDYESADISPDLGPIRQGRNTGRGRLRVVRVPARPEEDLDLSRCHVFRLVVAKQFSASQGVSVATGAGAVAGEALTDYAVWYYAPNGDRGCQGYDGPAPTPRPLEDAGVDSSSDTGASR